MALPSSLLILTHPVPFHPCHSAPLPACPLSSTPLPQDIVSLREGRYDAVFHLVTAAQGAERFYTLENNEARSETPQQVIEWAKLSLLLSLLSATVCNGIR